MAFTTPWKTGVQKIISYVTKKPSQIHYDEEVQSLIEQMNLKQWL